MKPSQLLAICSERGISAAGFAEKERLLLVRSLVLDHVLTLLYALLHLFGKRLEALRGDALGLQDLTHELEPARALVAHLGGDAG
jgi:hypothetical protein